MQHSVTNALYFLQKIQLTLKHLNDIDPQLISDWINEVDACQQVFEKCNVRHPILEKCVDFLSARLIEPFERQLENLIHNRQLWRSYKLEFQYTIKRMSLISQYIPNIVQVPMDDLFCKPSDHDDWLALNKFIEYVDVEIRCLSKLDDPQSLARAFAKFDDYIAVGCAYAKLGDKFNFLLIGTAIQNIGGAFLLAKIQMARDIKLAEITNPTLQFVQNLWSIQDKSQFIKHFMKATMPKIATHQKIYLPYLLEPTFTEAGILEEIESGKLYQTEELQGYHFVEHELYEKLTDSILRKDRKTKIKVRLLSANKALLKRNVHYPDIIHEVTDLSKHHHVIEQKPKTPKKSAITKVVLQIHGGGWVAMSSFSHQTYTRKWANFMGEDTIIFSIDYRLVPQYPYPLALEDVWQTYLWIINFSHFYLNVDPQQIVIAGDSAGGNMALGLCYRAMKCGIRLPDGLLLAYPACNLDIKDFNPYLLNGMVDQIAPSTILTLVLKEYLKSSKLRPDVDPYLSPIKAEDDFIRRLPRMTIMSGALDSLTGDCLKFVDRLRKVGKDDVRLYVYNGLSHGFLNFEVPLFAVPKIKPVIEKSCELLRELFLKA